MYRYYLRVIERIECIGKLIGSYYPIFSYKEYYFKFMGRMECIGKLIGSYYPIFFYKEYYFRFMGRMECIGKLIGSCYPDCPIYSALFWNRIKMRKMLRLSYQVSKLYWSAFLFVENDIYFYVHNFPKR